METMTKLAADFLTTIAYVQSGKEEKASMVVKMPRLLCEKIGVAASYGTLDERALVDAGIAIFNDTMGREQDGNGTYGYCKGFSQEKLVDWMNRFVRFVKENAGERLSRLRSLREEIILPVFKGEVINQRVEYFKRNKRPSEQQMNSNGETQ